ncbi:type IV pilus modification protein PilV [Desulfobotulus alkaliphilus]|nr:type IV pilus modification protein PilV [Desulfobotulus alkaliphilus]
MTLEIYPKKTGQVAECDLRSSSGFTLMEVLLVLVILSIGLLGLAALQNMALKDNHNALLRSRAVQQAEDILDRMRANRANMADYEIGMGDPDDWDPQSAVRATLATKLTAAGYTGMVHTDLLEWKIGLAWSLPGGDGFVEEDDGQVTVEIQWQEGDQTVSITVVTRP